MERGSRRCHAAKRTRHRDRRTRRYHAKPPGFFKSQSIAGTGFVWQSGHFALRRADQPSGPGRDRLAGRISD